MYLFQFVCTPLMLHKAVEIGIPHSRLDMGKDFDGGSSPTHELHHLFGFPNGKVGFDRKK